METIACEVCKAEMQIESYGDGECPACGAKYGWDEHYRLQLDQEMLDAVREILRKRTTRVRLT